MSSVRFICGTQDIHKQLEDRLAKFHDMDDCILFPSGSADACTQECEARRGLLIV